MSLYNMAAGFDPAAPAILSALGITRVTLDDTVPRFRDAYIDNDDAANPKLVIFTRTGGGNREEYAEANEKLRQMPGFIDDFDDSFDSTFAHWRYAIPDEHKEMFTELISEGVAAGWPFPKPMDRFKEAVEALQQSA